MALNLPPPPQWQPALQGENYSQPWMDWFFRVQAGAGTLSTITMPAELSISYSGDQATVSWVAQSAHYVFIGPTTGSSTPTFRRLVNSDLPDGLVITKAVDYTLVAGDGFVLVDTTSGAVDITLPTSLADGKEYEVIWQLGTNTLQILPSGADTLIGETSVVVSTLYTALRFKAVSGGYVLI